MQKLVKNKKKSIFILAIMLICLMAVPAFADNDDKSNTGTSIKVDAGIGTETDQEQLGGTIKGIITKVGSLIGVVAVCALIFNGFKLGMASDERKREEALSGIKWALIAVVIVGLAVMGVSFIASLVGGSVEEAILLYLCC